MEGEMKEERKEGKEEEGRRTRGRKERRLLLLRLMVLVVAGHIVAVVRSYVQLNSNAEEFCWFVRHNKYI